MTRFRDLLKPRPGSTPKDDQEHASNGLAEAVAESNLRLWRKGEPTPYQGKCLLLAVAPYSQYDLTLLDVIDESLAGGLPPAVHVYVVNLQYYDSAEQLGPDFPGMTQAHQPPLAAVWEPGSPKKVAWGKQARDLAAEALGLPAEDLSRRIKAESPSYTTVVRP
jgi:hypothetical protein